MQPTDARQGEPSFGQLGLDRTAVPGALDQRESTRKSTEALVRTGTLPDTIISDSQAARRIPSGDSPAAFFVSWANGDLTTVLRELEGRRSQIERSGEFVRPQSTGERAQANTYRLLNDPRNGILAELKRQGRIGAEWQLYPSEPQSPADKVGADFLLVNTRTGEFHFIDATTRADKGNIFSLRKGGIIVVNPELFDKLGALKVDDDRPDTAREAQKFRLDLSAQMESLTREPSRFKLGPDGCPLPGIVKTTASQTEAEIKALSDWSAEMARKSPDRREAELYKEMAGVVRNAASYMGIVQKEQHSAPFETRARQTAETEIVRYALSQMLRQPFEPASGPSAGSKVRLHKDGHLKLETAASERFDGGDIHDILSGSWKQLLDRRKLMGSLTDAQLKSLGADTSSFKKLKGEERAAALEKAYQNQPKFRSQADRLMSELHGLRATIEAGGARGSGNAVISESIVNRLSARQEHLLLGRPDPALTPAEVKPAPTRSGVDSLPLDLPNATRHLKELHPTAVAGKSLDKGVIESMDLLIMDQEEHPTWDKSELAQFKKLRDAYADPAHAEHTAAVESVNGLLNHEVATRAGSGTALPISSDVLQKLALDLPPGFNQQDMLGKLDEVISRQRARGEEGDAKMADSLEALKRQCQADPRAQSLLAEAITKTQGELSSGQTGQAGNGRSGVSNRPLEAIGGSTGRIVDGAVNSTTVGDGASTLPGDAVKEIDRQQQELSRKLAELDKLVEKDPRNEDLSRQRAQLTRQMEDLTLAKTDPVVRGKVAQWLKVNGGTLGKGVGATALFLFIYSACAGSASAAERADHARFRK